MRRCTSEDLDVEQMGSMLREFYEMDGLDFLNSLLFQFPGLYLDRYTIDEVRSYKFR
jgi:hypothetical protein